jgi:large subunit ribosomal protein L10
MPLNRKQKDALIADATKRRDEASLIVLTSFEGIDVEQDTKLRAEVRKSGAHYQVLKNTLAKRVLSGDEYKDLHAQMAGMTGYVFGGEDPVEAAKALTGFAKENEEVFQVKAGFFEGRVLTKDQLKALADTPSKPELLTRLATALKSPIQRFANVLAAPVQKLAGTIQAVADKKKEEGGEA